MAFEAHPGASCRHEANLLSTMSERGLKSKLTAAERSGEDKRGQQERNEPGGGERRMSAT